MHPRFQHSARPAGKSFLPAVCLSLWLLAIGLACASGSGSGFYHELQPGENLYRVGLRHGVPTAVLVKANRIDDVRNLQVGQRLWIPGGFSAAGSAASRPGRVASAARRQADIDLRGDSGLAFAWPVRARITSRFGRRGGRLHEGVDLGAKRGEPIRAAEAGRVIHSGRLSDYGKVVIIKHQGYYRSVYAHASKTLVEKGEFVERGQKIALVGATGRATGPHLHFEIRKRESPRDPMLYLP